MDRLPFAHKAEMTINRLQATKRLGVLCSIILVAVVTYLPAVDNFFISDDFTMLSYLESLKQNPASILNDPSELFRLLSYVYFWGCSYLFGLNSTGYYWAGIALHAIASLLLFVLVEKLTGRPLAAWTAALFFAAYERHQEAIMWISAANDLILTILCLVFLLLWLRNTAGSRLLAAVVFGLALFSKEPAVALLPLSVLMSVVRGVSWRQAFVKSSPLALMTAAYIYLWLSRANQNFFLTEHHYAWGLHFLPVSAQTVVRMVAPTILFMLPLFALAKRPWVRTVFREKALLFFGAVVCVTVVPYSFLTYLPSIPSRNTYLPSVGLAALVGLLFAALYPTFSTRRTRGFAVAFFVVMINQNIAYVWIKKEPQYLERAAPTRELIEALNGLDRTVASDASICVVDFPLHPWIGTESVKWFTRFDRNHMTFSTNVCATESSDVVMRWNTESGLSTEYQATIKDVGKVAAAP